MDRPKLEVADVFRRYGETYRQEHGASMSIAQRRVMSAIEACRTAVLGGHLERCDQCGFERNAFNSCRDRHCPKCQCLARAQWIQDRLSELLEVPYFHVVFTVPEEIAAIAYQNKEVGVPIPGAATYFLAKYGFSATANNGQITAMQDARTGSTVSYTYDSLKRVTGATGSGGSMLSQTFGYDGFGNLTSKSVPAGSSEFVLPGVNAAKNWLNGSTYDQNGNVATLNNATLSYDVENRLSEYTTGSFVENYAYDEANRRVDKFSSGADNVYFYGPNGKLLTVVQVNFLASAPSVTMTTVSNRIYFGGMLLGTTNGSANTDSSLMKDRLGSVQPSYAYGTATGSGQQTSPGDDFATYWKDASSGFEYAMNRYYSAGYGRFLTVDILGGSARLGSPGGWNRYTYASDDPGGRYDPAGLGDSCPDDDCPLDPFGGWGDNTDVVTNLAVGGAAYGRFEGLYRAKVTHAWTVAVATLSNGNQLLHNLLNGNASGNCQGDINDLQSVGVSSVGVLAMTAAEGGDQWVNAIGNTDLVLGTDVPGSDVYNSQLQHGASQMIDQYVDQGLNGGVEAVSTLPGSALWGNIYFNPFYVAGLSSSEAAALLWHEVAYTLGATDIQIQTALFGANSPQVGVNSDNITQKLYQDCFPPPQ